MAEALLKHLSLQSLLKVRAAMQQTFMELKVSQSSQNTYGGRVEQWLKWAEQESWWWNKRSRSTSLQDQCAPPRSRQHGAVDETKLMPGKGRPVVYSLKDKETSPALAQVLDDLFHFLSDYHHPYRVIDKIEASTAKGYLKDIRLFLGWRHRYHKPALPLEKFSLDLLFPKISEETLEKLTPKQLKRFWRQHKAHLKQWIQQYFQFLAKVANSHSPRTRVAKLNALFAVGYFQYALEMDEAAEYKQIPLFDTLKALSKEYADQVKEWTVDRRYVADQSKKWPNVPEGKTALKVVQEEVIEHCGNAAVLETPMAISTPPNNGPAFWKTSWFGAIWVLNRPDASRKPESEELASPVRLHVRLLCRLMDSISHSRLKPSESTAIMGHQAISIFSGPMNSKASPIQRGFGSRQWAGLRHVNFTESKPLSFGIARLVMVPVCTTTLKLICTAGGYRVAFGILRPMIGGHLS